MFNVFVFFLSFSFEGEQDELSFSLFVRWCFCVRSQILFFFWPLGEREGKGKGIDPVPPPASITDLD